MLSTKFFRSIKWILEDFFSNLLGKPSVVNLQKEMLSGLFCPPEYRASRNPSMFQSKLRLSDISGVASALGLCAIGGKGTNKP